MLLKHRIAQLVAQGVEEAQRSGVLPQFSVPEIEIERPQLLEHGDFATSLPLRLARAARMSPMAIAEGLAPRIAIEEPIERVEVASPGFINFAISQDWLRQQVESVLEQGEAYGSVDLGEGQRIQIEFVSVNPTGPLHVGHARGAVLGSGLASILAVAGYDVSREYYINDTGTQMDAFARTIYAHYLQAHGRDAEVPPDGYMGSYMVDLAGEVVEREKDRFLTMPVDEAVSALREIGLKKMLGSIREDLERIRVEFDVWFSEQSLYDSGDYEAAMDILRGSGYLAEREGATWFTSTALGEDKDNVVVRSTGAPTYFASDIAYHYNKLLKRGYDRVVNIWGADHQGHVSRMNAVVGALGADADRLTIIISQMVALKRGEETVRISKRTGDLITLRELVDEVGSDACRFFFLSRTAGSQMDFDLELAKKESDDNPVYYIQYAYARIAGIMRLAQERGLDYAQGDVSLLTHEAEVALIRNMLLLPEIIEGIALSLEPHHLPRYTVELATAFHWFYQQCRVVSNEPGDEAITQARLKLTEACRTVLARCLSLMGMSAPERM
ncbi:MAG: arginine--tRNA ligase [Chloroflexi bacterium]|nr:arginine--tRNA ligase [Chloroflexota bacterium]